MATLAISRNRVGETAAANRAIRQLDPTIKVRRTGITNFGSVARAGGQTTSLGMPSSITFTLDNSLGGTAAGYRIGDDQDWVVELNGYTGTALADASSGISAKAFGVAVAQAPVAVGGINYSSTSGAVQFGLPFFFCQGEVDGTRSAKPVNIAEYQRNTANNANLMTLEFQDPFVLDWNTGFYILAGIGQVVQVTLMFAAADNR